MYVEASTHLLPFVYCFNRHTHACTQPTAASVSTPVTVSYGLLVLVDIAIMFWIFSAIVETRRTLRVRKNLVKLSMYNHFSYALIFAMLATIGFVIWDILAHFYPSNGCLTVCSKYVALYRSTFSTIIMFNPLILTGPVLTS